MAALFLLFKLATRSPRSFFMLFLLLACMNVNSQVYFKTEYFGSSSYRMTEGETDEKVGDSKGSAMVYQGGINIPLSVKTNENGQPKVWGIGAGASYASLDNKNFTEDLVIDEILNIGLSLYHIRPISNRWSMMISAGGGIYLPDTRFSQINRKNILGNAGIIFIRHLRPNLDIGGGIAMNNSFGYPMVFPALYLDWKVESRFSVNISMLDGLEMSAGYTFNKYISLDLAADMNGQLALLEKDNEDMMFTHQYIVTGLRPTLKIGKHLSLVMTAGISAVRTAEYRERTLKAMFSDKGYYFQIAPYASAKIVCGF